MQLEAGGLQLVFYDRDSIFSPLIKTTLKSLGIDAVRTSYQSPWQNGIAERFVGNVRREMLDHVIIINCRHLYRLMQEYVDYYHNDRTHYALAKETPANRLLQEKPSANARLLALPRLGGLHHRYVWKDAA
ncbi:MAG: integrase core domain-containing protein, partial [Candidatus Aminicenantes bacterium]|nr:integrase core domain-containing protein [Candidatus Aminicenantes bacterium]